MFGIIYKAINKINGKVYIGQTIKTLEGRRSEHLRDNKSNDYNSAFHKALRKYGEDSFEWEVIVHCGSKEEMDDMEFHYIKQYNSYNSGGYNLTWGGEGCHGRKYSYETIKKMSESHKGVKLPKEQVRKILATRMRRNYTGLNNKAGRMYVLTTPEGDVFKVFNLDYFCKRFTSCKLNASSLYKVIKGDQISNRGYKCEHYDEIKHKNIKEFDYARLTKLG